MERKIGEVFDYFGVTLITVISESEKCGECYLKNPDVHKKNRICTRNHDLIGCCTPSVRDDRKWVRFERVKVG